MAARDRVMGHDLPGPRVTPAGLRLAALWLAGPVVALLIAADLLGWWIARMVWGVCFGVVCLLG
ncbi:MAG: hypothetical protein ACK4WC_03975 [Rubrimonas sp.]